MPDKHVGTPGAVLVITHRAPSPSDPDPRVRQVARRIDVLARLTTEPVRVLALEASPYPPDWADPARVNELGIPADPVQAIHHAIAGTGVAWLTDASMGRYLPTDARPPLVLDIDLLPSVAASSSRRPLGRNSDGLDTLVRTLEGRESDLFSACAVIVCGDDSLATEVRRRTEVAIRQIAPSAPPIETARPFIQRSGALHYGRWTSEPGHPDEDGLDTLMAALGEGSDVLETVLGQDVGPSLRSNLPDSATISPPAAWLDRFRTSRLAVLPRRFGAPPTAALAELAAFGVPFLAPPGALAALPESVDPESFDLGSVTQWADRLRAGVYDRSRWTDLRTAVTELADEWLDPPTNTTAVKDVLELVGVATRDPGREPKYCSPPTYAPPRRPGTISDAPPLIDFETRLLGHTLMGRDRYLTAQEALDHGDSYDLWRAAHLDSPRALEQQRVAAGAQPGPTISIVLPTYDADPVLLAEAIESVREQTWPDWQLCIVDDASPDGRGRQVVEAAARSDERIVARFLDENLGIAGATNAAIELATGDLVGFLDHDDVLRPSALWWVVQLLDEQADLDLIYTDEDRLDPDGRVIWPFFKPDWSPDLLLSVNYITHFVVVRRNVLEQVGGIRLGFDGAQDHDFLLRVTEVTDAVGHIAKPLYSWRQVEGSTSAESYAKPEAHAAGQRAIEEALHRRGESATVRPGFGPNWHWVRHHSDDTPLVSVIVPTRNRVELLEACVNRARETADYPALEFVVVDNQSDDAATIAWLDQFESSGQGKVVRYPHRFSFARQINLAAAASNGSVLLMLNNDTRALTANWLREMLGHALRPEVGAVGARLLWPDGRPQHEGIVLNVADVMAWNMSATDLSALTRNTRDTTAVTGACLMSRRSVFEAVGGLDEQLRVAFNDVDYCLRVGELGYRVLYSPWAELVHAESSSRGTLHPDDDERFYEHRWGAPWSVRDPFYNVNLDMADPVKFRL